MVHKALEQWQFPDDPNLASLLETEALTQGLGSEIIRTEAVHRAIDLLERFRKHILWEEIDNALERHHELPYSYQLKGWVENRFIDLLYRDGKGWHVVDFKTDPILGPSQKSDLLREYTPQVRRYIAAVKQLLGVDAQGSICFLDDHGRIEQVEIGA